MRFLQSEASPYSFILAKGVSPLGICARRGNPFFVVAFPSGSCEPEGCFSTAASLFVLTWAFANGKTAGQSEE